MANDGILRIDEDSLLALASGALRAHGMAADDADQAARILVLADLCGIGTHGVDRIPSYTDRLRIGGIDPRPSIAITPVAPSIVMVDGANGLGPLVGAKALQAAMDAGRASGLAAAFVRGSNHFGPIMPYCFLAAEAGFASIICSNATTTIAPWGGREARLGNNPIGMGVPQPGGTPIILDIAMSVVARVKLRRSLERGESIPTTWATNRDGEPTDDPKAALDGFLSVIGGHKGYGLALMVDLFAGLLSGAAYLTHVSSWSDTPKAPQNLGHYFMLIDVNRLGATERLSERMNDFRSILHGTPPIDPSMPVMVPGEIEMTKLARQRRDGIEIPSWLVDALKRLAAQEETSSSS